MPGKTSEALQAKIRTQAENRCGYCLTRQEYLPWILKSLTLKLFRNQDTVDKAIAAPPLLQHQT
jgi:hypothetical protein